MERGPIRVLELAGEARDRGRAHGEAYADEIRAYADERIDLVCQGQWSSHRLERASVLAIAEECVPAHAAYSRELTDELRGLAESTRLSLGELVIAGGFTDFVDVVYGQLGHEGVSEDDCTAMIVPDARAGGAGFLAQTWDMHDTATDFVVLLDVRPTDGPRSLVFSTVGCLGQIGMNDAGICIGINNLAGADGRVGVTWPFVVRKALEQTDLDDALECITGAALSGAHNYLLFDSGGRGYNVEAFSTTTQVTELRDEILVHANHALTDAARAVSRERPAELKASSEARLRTGVDALARGTVELDDLVRLIRHPTICYQGAPPFRIETCGAAIMRPRTGDLWACWGLPSENEFERFTLSAVAS